MKVFYNTREGNYGYSGGMILVAANTPEEAHAAFHADPRYKCLWYHFEMNGNSFDEDEEYFIENWKELPMLTANVNHPQVIAENGYTE